MHGKSKDSGRLFFMHGGKEQRNPPPRFETVGPVKEGEKREAVDLVLERGVKHIARGKGKLEDLSLAGTQIVEATFDGNPTIFPSDHVTLTVTSKGKLNKFTACGDIEGMKPEKGKITMNIRFSPAVSPESTTIFYAWRGHGPKAREPIGKKVFRDRRQRRR